MAGKQKKSSGGTRKYGRNARRACHVRYNVSNQRLRNKLARIAKSNGMWAVRQYRKGVTHFDKCPPLYKGIGVVNYPDKLSAKEKRLLRVAGGFVSKGRGI